MYQSKELYVMAVYLWDALSLSQKNIEFSLTYIEYNLYHP